MLSVVRTDKDHASYLLYAVTEITHPFRCMQQERSRIICDVRTDKDKVFIRLYALTETTYQFC